MLCLAQGQYPSTVVRLLSTSATAKSLSAEQNCTQGLLWWWKFISYLLNFRWLLLIVFIATSYSNCVTANLKLQLFLTQYSSRASLLPSLPSGSEPGLLRYIQCWYRLPVDRYHRHQAWKLHTKGESQVRIQCAWTWPVCEQHKVIFHGRQWGSRPPKQIDLRYKIVIKLVKF